MLAEKNDDNENMKEELNKYRENVDNLNKLNESVSEFACIWQCFLMITYLFAVE